MKSFLMAAFHFPCDASSCLTVFSYVQVKFEKQPFKVGYKRVRELDAK